MENVRVVLANLPPTIKAYTICKEDFYTIVLNSNLSHEQNKKSYDHEMQHIINRDFDSTLPAGMIEICAHK